MKALQAQAKRWRRSHDLRLFVQEALRQGSLKEQDLAGTALKEWAEWALQQADRLDPFTASPPSILDDEERIKKMCDHLRGW